MSVQTGQNRKIVDVYSHRQQPPEMIHMVRRLSPRNLTREHQRN